jgi:beta-N-acetylhexosaminidase
VFRLSRRGLALAACIVLALTACVACGSASGRTAAEAPTTWPPLFSTLPATAAGAEGVRPPLSCPARIESQMTEAQRIGQLFLVAFEGNPVAEATSTAGTRHFGSWLLAASDSVSTTALAAELGAVQAQASSSATRGVKYFVAANQEGGEVQALGGPGFPAMPSALDQGQLSVRTLEDQAAAWGRALRSAGVNLNLAPVMDVVPRASAAQNAPIVALQREFGYDPQTNGAHGVAFIEGMRQAGVASVAKHFPGLGQVRGNTDFTADVVDTTTAPGSADLGSFGSAIAAGVPFVMVALATYTKIDAGHLAVFSSRVMDGLLRQQMHFRGVIVSDDLGAAAAVAGIPAADRGVDFLAAGGDLITSQSLSAAESMEQGIAARVASDSSFRSVVNAAVLRVLTAKQASGLLPCSSS